MILIQRRNLLKDSLNHLLGEAADLLYHYIVLLQAKGCELGDVVNVLERRSKK